MHIKKLKVVTFRILAFLGGYGGYVVALLKGVCSPLKKICSGNLLWGMSPFGYMFQIYIATDLTRSEVVQI